MQYEVAIFIGRMQPFHLAHKASVEKALTVANKVLILAGSSYKSLSPKNPWSFEDRKAMILACFPEDEGRIEVLPVVDYSNDDSWVVAVQQTVSRHTSVADHNICLVGHKKDRSSYYIDMFPQWDFVESMERTIPLDATTIREDIFSESTDRASYWRAVLPEAVIQFMERWKKTEAYAIRKEEWDYYQSYDPKKFDITMQTVDAVVVCAGHILMIRRKFAPGKGLWALPGGFLNKRERIKDGILRELKEETGLRVNKEELTKRLENIRYFDDPDRSLRGRVISHAGLIRLDPDPRTRKLPEVRGADDADAACWLSLQDILANRGNVFEDHDNIILTMLGLS